ICIKDCFYCGIRKSNPFPHRYSLNDQEILQAARYAWQNHYGSIVLQGGERNDPAFVLRIEKLLKDIKKLSRHELGITLSLGEQTEETYKKWFHAGAHRYLLRIETSNSRLYRQIHPQNKLHDYHTRLQCLRILQKCGYQTGTGVMIGLPFQSIEDLADDLLFLKTLDVDMVGMGPYLEHQETPLWAHREQLFPPLERFRLGLHMIICLRLLMPDINIAATTALQAIIPEGREKALEIGANVIMPNITPAANRSDYQLYENKPELNERCEEYFSQLSKSIRKSGCEIKPDTWGDSPHWKNRL
ncbi:MAG: [FeFe] hydrogenase H-cluster radical SAM maturase HydE, partial [Odoribacter sp.]|nr:[FeFe] hydrogenase H-cluster radical SAM maturase HydE [Odoribacter sp.]